MSMSFSGSGSVTDSQSNHKDLVDFIKMGVVKNVVKIDASTGQQYTEIIQNDKSIRYRGVRIHSILYGAVVYELQHLYRLGRNAYNNMDDELADNLMVEIEEYIENTVLALESLTAITVLNKHNKQKSLIDILGSSEQTRILEGKDQVGMLERLFAGKPQQAQQNQ